MYYESGTDVTRTWRTSRQPANAENDVMAAIYNL